MLPVWTLGLGGRTFPTQFSVPKMGLLAGFHGSGHFATVISLGEVLFGLRALHSFRIVCKWRAPTLRRMRPEDEKFCTARWQHLMPAWPPSAASLPESPHAGSTSCLHGLKCSHAI